MGLITGPFLSLIFATLIVTVIFRIILELCGVGRDAWCMPSGLGAVMGSVNYLSYAYYGFGRLEFAMTVVFAAAVCYESVRLRRVSAEHAALINRLARELKRLDPECDLPATGTEEDVGSGLIQILLGIVLGILLTMLIGSMLAFQYSSM